MLRELKEGELLQVQGGEFCAAPGSSHVLVLDVGCGGTGGGFGYRSTATPPPGGGANTEDLRQMAERILLSGGSGGGVSPSVNDSEHWSGLASLYGNGRELFTTRTDPYPSRPGIWD